MSSSSESPIVQLLRSNSELSQLLTSKPELRQTLTTLLESEQQFQQHRSQGDGRGGRGRGGGGARGRGSSRGPFQQENRMLSPLEQKLIEGDESDEQRLLRLLVKIIQETV